MPNNKQWETFLLSESVYYAPPPDIEHEGEEAPLGKEAVLRYHIEQYPDPATSQSQIDRARIDKVNTF